MHETILEVTLAVLAVGIANAIAPRVRLAAPILLVVIGILASAIPAFGNLEFGPELVLAGSYRHCFLRLPHPCQPWTFGESSCLWVRSRSFLL